MAKIRLKIIGLSQGAEKAKEDTINVKDLGEILQRLELKYPQDYYTFNIFLNGILVDDTSKTLHNGDEVAIIPIMSGG